MILVAHILIALTSVAFATYAFFAPTSRKIATSYGLIAATLVSGTFLVLSTNASMIHACTTGLVYALSVSVVTYAAQRKLATVHSETRDK
jgi:hypothetical protein